MTTHLSPGGSALPTDSGPTAPLRIRVIRTGVVRSKRRQQGLRRYLPGAWAEGVTPVNAFVVECATGMCLFDTGQRVGSAPFPGRHPYLRLARFELARDDEAAAQVDAGNVRWVVLSHLHTDHVGGAAAFPGAQFFVSRSEWRRGTGIRGRLRGYVPWVWPSGVEPTLVELVDPSPPPFAGALDLSGDGALILVGTPGHTPGHLSLLVTTPDWRVLLAGDLAHDSEALELTAPAVAAWCRAEGVAVCAAHDQRAASILGEIGAL